MLGMHLVHRKKKFLMHLFLQARMWSSRGFVQTVVSSAATGTGALITVPTVWCVIWLDCVCQVSKTLAFKGHSICTFEASYRLPDKNIYKVRSDTTMIQRQWLAIAVSSRRTISNVFFE